MKKLISLFLSLIFLLTISWFVPKTQAVTLAKAHSTFSINAVIGDQSFVATFGRLPNIMDRPDLRVKTHLEYVENILRNRDVSNLSPSLKNQRTKTLNLLHEYINIGKFPQNFDYAENRSCFVDRNGNICAVGYLVQQTAGNHLVQKINTLYRYSLIPDIHVPELAQWVSKSGLTPEECSMIQPGYPGQDPLKDFLFRNQVILLTFLSTTLTFLNFINREATLTRSVVEIISGAMHFISLLIGYKDLNADLAHPFPAGLFFYNTFWGTSMISLGIYDLSRYFKNKENEDAQKLSINFKPFSETRSATLSLNFSQSF